MKIIPFLILMTFGLVSNAQNILTIGEVFNYDIGDEFHFKEISDQYQGDYIPPNADRLTIIDKFYSNDGDTIFYIINQNSYYTEMLTEPPNQRTIFYTDTITQFYSDLDSSIYFFDEINIWDTTYKFIDFPWFSYDSILDYSSSLCNEYINGFECHDSDFEPNIYIKEYAAGLGLTRYARIDEPAPYITYDNQLFYYKKLDKTCGTPDLITATHILVHDLLEVYPNPSSDYLTIIPKDSKFSEYKVLIYNLTGELEDLKRIEGNLIDISALSSGIYLIQFQIEDKILIKKIIKQ
jgi:hypothetical protein